MNEKQLQGLIDRTEGRLPSLCCSGKCRAWKNPASAQKKQLAYLKNLLKHKQQQIEQEVNMPRQIQLSFFVKASFITLCALVGCLLFTLGDSRPISLFFGLLCGSFGGYSIIKFAKE